VVQGRGREQAVNGRYGVFHLGSEPAPSIRDFCADLEQPPLEPKRQIPLQPSPEPLSAPPIGNPFHATPDLAQGEDAEVQSVGRLIPHPTHDTSVRAHPNQL
jgi:hypothetical protein